MPEQPKMPEGNPRFRKSEDGILFECFHGWCLIANLIGYEREDCANDAYRHFTQKLLMDSTGGAYDDAVDWLAWAEGDGE